MSPAAIDSLQALKDYVGKEIGVSDWFRVSQERIRQFAEATEDRQWIHLDPERAAAESPYGAPIAHGFLTLSLAGYFLEQVIRFKNQAKMTVNYGLNRVRFPAPVAVGSLIRGRFAVKSASASPGYLEAVLAAAIEVQGSEKPCCVLEWVIRYYE